MSDKDEQNDTADLKSQLLSADEVSNPSIKPWKLDSLEKKQEEKQEKILSSVIQSLKKEAAPEVQKQTKLIKKTAYDEAYKKGYEAGFKKGLNLGKVEGKEQALHKEEKILQPKVDSLQELVEFMLQPYQAVSEEVFLNLIEIVVEISSKLIKDEIAENSDWILKVLNEAVVKLPFGSKPIKIYLNSEDFAVVEQYSASNNNVWELFVDDKLAKGTCRIKQESSTLVDDWQQKLNEVMGNLKKKSKELLSDEQIENEIDNNKS